MAAFMRKKIPTFSPTNISGCQVWFDAADGSSIIAPNGPVLSWTSKGAAAMTATPSGTAPTYSKYNGFPGVAFNGTSTKMLTSTTGSFGTTGTTWIAVSVNFSPVSASLPPDASVVMATQGGTGPERGIRYSSSIAATSYSINNGTLRQDTGNNTNGIRGFIETASAFNAYTNGTNTATVTTPVTFQASSNQGLVMGQWNIGWLNGFIFELLIYNRDLTVPEYQQVEAYLAQKWGYKGALPPGHPGTVGVIVPTVSKSIARPTLYFRNYQLTQIPGCLLWLDAADPAATGSVGTAITTWRDKSGNNNHFTLTSGTATVVQDGPYAVVGIPTGTLLTSTNTIAATSNTSVFAVFKATSTALMMFLAFSGLVGGDFSIRCASYVIPTGGSTNANDLFNGVTTYVDGNAGASANMSTYHIVSGTMSTSGTTAVTISSTSSASTRMFIGNAAEVVMYSGALTTAQRQAVESYLANKWGLVTGLPAGHADKATPAGLPAAVPAVMRLIFALSRFMSTVYNLSSYSLAGIANTVSLSTGTPAYVWVASVPPNAKGKNGILAVVFNLYNSAGFSANMLFDYGVYVDGVSQFMGDSATMRYVQTSNGNYAIAYGGISLGTNGIMGGLPLFFPLVLGPSASLIQIGLANSSMTMTGVASAAPSVGSNVVTSTGTLNTGNYVPQNTFTTTGLATYTVPTTVQGGTVTGVYMYCWGSGGFHFQAAGAGGFVSGFYPCAGGTNLRFVVGISDGQANINTGGSGIGNGAGGGFSGVFLSNAGGLAQSNVLIIAGAGGMDCYIPPLSASGNGGGGAYGSNAFGIGYSGGNPYVFGVGDHPTVTGGSLSAGGVGMNGKGGAALCGGATTNNTGEGVGGGGGYYGGGGSTWNSGSNQGGGGGSSFAANAIVSPIFASATRITNSALASTAVPPGGNTSPFYVLNSNGYGYGGSNLPNYTVNQGLVVIVPAVGTAATQIGVSATLFSA